MTDKDEVTFSLHAVCDFHLLARGEELGLAGGFGLLVMVVSEAIRGALAVPHRGWAGIHNSRVWDRVGLLGRRVCHCCCSCCFVFQAQRQRKIKIKGKKRIHTGSLSAAAIQRVQYATGVESVAQGRKIRDGDKRRWEIKDLSPQHQQRGKSLCVNSALQGRALQPG